MTSAWLHAFHPCSDRIPSVSSILAFPGALCRCGRLWKPRRSSIREPTTDSNYIRVIARFQLSQQFVGQVIRVP